jgi:hypothetical protein
MNLIIRIVIFLLAAEIIVIIGFVWLVYGLKIYQLLTRKDRDKIYKSVIAAFNESMEKGGELTRSQLRRLNKDILTTLKAADEYDKTHEKNEAWAKTRDSLIKKVLLPQMHRLYKAGKIYKRYYAANLFNYYFQEEDAEMVAKLIKDPVLLVSVDAARVGFKFKSSPVINAAIDSFANYRRLQQSIYSSMAIDCGVEVEKIITDRLSIEKDGYVKAFCYRLLSQFPSTIDVSSVVKADLDGKVIELRLSALNYAAHNHSCRSLIKEYLSDDQWQMRSTAAKLLGIIKDHSAVSLLGEKLSDKEWWVRIRAAEALSELGEKGIAILKEQSPEKDKFAYEAAIQVLVTDKNTRAP